MIVYLDTSAIVPLLVLEPGSAACARIWNDADEVLTSRLAYVEVASALARAERLERLTTAAHRQARTSLERLWAELDLVEVDQDLVERAAQLARRFNLRGYDAVHCASAAQVADEDVVAAAGDQALLASWARMGLATYDTNVDAD